MLLYHIPTYQFLELSGVKNPSSKLWLSEMRVWPLTRDCVAVKVSKDEANSEVKRERIVKNNKGVMERWCLVVIDFMLQFVLFALTVFLQAFGFGFFWSLYLEDIW